AKSTESTGASGLTKTSFVGVTKAVPVVTPEPVRPVRSTENTTWVGPPKSGSVTALASILAFPVKRTLSAPPVTTPTTLTTAELSVAVNAASAGWLSAQTNAPTAPANSHGSARAYNTRCIFMILSIKEQ